MARDFTAMIDLSKYDCFRVKETLDQSKYQFLSILRSDNCDLKLLRTKLWDKFGVPTDRCIFYFDEDEDQVPINLECEFEEALELTRKATTADTAILLIVGNFSPNNLHWKMSSNEHNCQMAIHKELDGLLLHYWHSSSPPLWFTTYMESMKKDIVATVTSQVMKDIKDLLKRSSLLFVSNPPVSNINEENQKTHSQNDECSNINASIKLNESVNTNTDDDLQTRAIPTLPQEILQIMEKNDVKTLHQLVTKLYEKLFRLEKAIDTNMKEEKKMFHEHHQLLSQITTDNLGNNLNKSGQINLPTEPSDEKSFSNTVNTVRTENELRMSCSVTGHQMLDESRSSKDISRCDDRTLSDDEKEKEDESFEIIQMPDSENPNESFIQSEEPQHNSSRDSPSFELVSEASSTRVSPPSSTYMYEDHFSTFEDEHLCTPVCNLRHLMDFHERLLGRRFDPHSYYSMAALKLYSTMTCPSKLPDMSQQSEEWKSPRSSKCPINRCMNYGTHDDMKDSHASYRSVPSYCGSTQSQWSVQSNPSNDGTQSFHSHTTSITDTPVYAEPKNKFGCCHAHSTQIEHPTASEDVQAATMLTKDNPDVPPCGMCWRCLLTVVAPYTCSNEECIDCNFTLPKILEKYFSENVTPCTSHNDTAQTGYDRASEFSEKSKTMFSNEQTNELGTVDSVHILPETLVTAATQVGCFAYDTAREMFDKLRAHAKEEPVKCRDETKCDNRKSRIRTDSKNC